MQARLLQAGPPSGRFPRWGYLDKYAANEYIARSVLLVAVTTWAALGAVEIARRQFPFQVPTHVPKTGFRDVVIIDPAPVFPVPNLVRSHPRPQPSRVQPIVPRPVPMEDVEAIGPQSVEGPGDPSGSIEADEPLPVGDGGGFGLTEPVEPQVLLVVEREPILVSIRAPTYPEMAREAGIEGTVLVRILVWNDGSVRDVTVLQSVLGLDEAALASAATAVFRPAQQQDRPVATWTIVPIEFRLHD